MSQMTATARPLRTPRRGPAPTPLRVIPSSITRTGTGTFAATCIALLIAGLIALLLLNTALAQGSLALGDLQRESARLSDTAGNLQGMCLLDEWRVFMDPALQLLPAPPARARV